ncbi:MULTISPECIES: tetratricopeptide repeat protein [Marinobacter]|uniref:tetratricopeptide repeat protein n=1 Tax=Marinobacter TaxID=2742 RepID=UPI0010AAED7D|nr:MULTISPECIES: tetratricopeptide repeat protein [Marinobacter]MBJ7301348.1 tetratricopeptide repeat protein [Marinobacter salarius]HIO29122.1 tetratricopeptide repeat protein [Marinobacter salarius]HIO98302.1 tetratricopeptide repeat protein [Marinobacter salarius]
MHKSALLLGTCLLGLSLSGCAFLQDNQESQSTSSPDDATASSAEPSADIRYADFEPEELYLLLSGEIAAQRGRFDVTLVNYMKAAQQSRDLGVIERTMRIAQSLNADNAQQKLAALWLEVAPNNMQAHRISAIQAVKKNELETALGHMEKIMDLGGDADFDSLAAMAGNLPPEQQQELLDLYQQLEQRHPDNPELQYSIALLLKVTGEPQQALAKLEPLLDSKPDFQPALILKGDLLYQTNQKQQALDHLRANTRQFPDNRQMGTLYGRMLIGEGELQTAQNEFRRLVNRFPDVPGLRLSYALVALENDQIALAEEELTRLIEQGHHSDEAHYYLGRIADEENENEQAIGYYRNVEKGNYFFPALARASELMAEQGELDEALADIREIRKNNPDQDENFRLLEINLLLDRDHDERALQAANEALESFPGNVRIRYARAMLLDSMDKPEQAEADLRTIIEEQPDNAVALNALGYILTTRTDRLDEARDYIERALAIDPENPAILDSMGWVLYLQGNTDESLSYLSRAWEAYADPEVAAHYGEALWQTGNQEQARSIWREGFEQDPDHPILTETVERLTGEPSL